MSPDATPTAPAAPHTALTPSGPDQAIAARDAAWGDAATRQDLDAVVALYTADATLVWPDEPAVHGADAIRQAYQGMFASMPGLTLRFVPERIVVAEAGDLASDFGAVEFGLPDGSGGTNTTVAKYLVVWRREGDAWRVLYDAWNGNTKAT